MRILFYLVFILICIFHKCDNPLKSEDINKPKNFSLNQSWDGIELIWDDNNKYEDGYNIFRNNQNIASLSENMTEYLDYTFSPFIPLSYYVSCYKDNSSSESSDVQNISIALSFYDRFNYSLSSKWYSTQESTVLTNVGGELNIDGDDSDGFQHNAYFYEDIQTPFNFGAKMKKISGDNGEPFGIGIRSESTNARIFIFISGAKKISVMEYNNDWRDLLSPVFNNSISSEGFNEIRVCLDQNKLKVYLNNNEFCLLNYLFSENADCFFLYTQSDLSVNFDDVYLFKN